MKIVVIGGSGLIGSKLVTKLGEQGSQAVAASPNTGVNSVPSVGRRAFEKKMCIGRWILPINRKL